MWNRYGIEKAWVIAFVKKLATAGWEARKGELDADYLMIWTAKMLTPYRKPVIESGIHPRWKQSTSSSHSVGID